MIHYLTDDCDLAVDEGAVWDSSNLAELGNQVAELSCERDDLQSAAEAAKLTNAACMLESGVMTACLLVLMASLK